MKPKHGALVIALILAAVATLLFIVLPASANLTIAYISCLVGIVLLEGGFLLANLKNVPASYTLIQQTGWFLPWSLAISAIILALEWLGVFTLPAIVHGIAHILLLAVSAIRLAQVFSGAAYINEVEKKVADRRTSWVDLVNQASFLAAQEQDMEAKAALKKVAEALRYSDPIGTGASQQTEEQIEGLIKKIQADNKECKLLCGELLLLIQKRNAIVKTNK